MATLFNNTEITNAFFNGTELDKIYFNGVLVFEKGGKYLRRIMVGDDLRNKIITTAPHTNTVYQFLRNYIDNNPDIWYLSFISTENEILDPNYEKGSFCAIQTYDENGIYVPYDFYRGVSPIVFLDGTSESDIIINNNVEIPFVEEDLTIVTETIDNNPVYRWLYIEDENIRPFEVGDIIIPGTKIYLAFPDNCLDNLEIDFYLSFCSLIGVDNSNEQIDILFYKTDNNQNFYNSILMRSSNYDTMEYYSERTLFKINNGNVETNLSLYTFLNEDFGESNSYKAIDPAEFNPYPTFYNKILVDTRTLGTTGYKRRIMVGDNLKGKTIYFDFPENYYQIISEEIGMGNQRQAIISDVKTTYIVENNLSPSFEVRVINGVQWQNNIYNYQNGNLITNLTSLSLENFGNVITVNDNQAYRHIYIEDNKIRPIQVGDVITRNTKFYFTIPDNIFEQLPQGRDDVIILNNGESISLNADSFSSSIHFNTTSGMDSNMNIIVVINNKLMANKSAMQNISYNGDYFEGTVSEVNNSSPVYSMIFVDIATLG